MSGLRGGPPFSPSPSSVPPTCLPFESRAAEGPHGEQWVLLAGSSLSASAETGPSLVALTLASPTTVPGTVAQQD